MDGENNFPCMLPTIYCLLCLRQVVWSASLESNGKRVRRLSWYGILQVICRWLCVLFFRIRISGRENLPAKGGVLVLSNHQSFLDPVLIGVGLSRPIHYMARSDLFSHWLFRWVIRSLNAFPVKREGVDLRAIRKATELLRKEEVVVLFPEGTRTWTGALSPIRPGFTLVARQGQAAILPAIIHGAFQAWPRSRRFLRPHPISVMFGKPIYPREYLGKTAEELRQSVQEAILAIQREVLWKPERR